MNNENKWTKESFSRPGPKTKLDNDKSYDIITSELFKGTSM